MMEQAYAAVAQAIVQLVSGTGENADHATNQAVLRSTLQLRPVTLGYALSTFAGKLREAGEQSQASTAAPAAVRVPHLGIRLALEVVLGSSYDRSTPHAVVSVVDALGEDRLEALLLAPADAEPLLPWAARLCLLHACLAAGAGTGTGTGTARRWDWLPAVADSASSLALQEIAMKGGGGGAVSNGKGRVRAPPNGTGRQAAGTGETEAFSAASMAQVCGELAAAGLAGHGTASRKTFPWSYPSTAPGITGSGLSSGRAAGLLPGGQVSASFRLKLQSLRDALLCGAEGSREAAELTMPSAGATAVGGVGLEDLEIDPGSVRRALERGRCGDEAFILAAQAALERRVPPGGTPEFTGGRRDSSPQAGRRASVGLKHALETCLLGSGLPTGRGLLDAVAVDDLELSFLASPGFSSTAGSRPVGTRRPSRATSVPAEARQACALMQGLVEEGVRIRDLVLTLLGMHQERERRRPPSRPLPPPAASAGTDAAPRRRTGADVVATVQPACDFLRRPLAEVVRAFVEWLADTPWVWGATEGVEGEDWEGDFSAAALAISTVYACPPAAGGAGADTGVVAATPVEQRGFGGNPAWGVPPDVRRVDPTDVLDRLVAGAAMAMGHADASSVEWVDVLQRVASAATATDSLRAYAVACVEKSAALGGQAPFRVAGMGKRRFSQVRGKQLWGLLSGLLEGAYGLNGGSLAGEQAPTAVLIRAAAASAVIASRKASQSWMISPGLLCSGPVRTVVDMLNSANGRVTASDVLAGVLQRPGDGGPALAADVFAAFVAAAASGEAERGDSEGAGLRSQATAWLGGALSASHTHHDRSGGLSMGMDSSTAEAALARHMIRRVPFEAKPVLLAVQEAAELAAAGGGLGASSPRHTGKRKHVPGKGKGPGGLTVVASLLKAARAAMQSPLLPLPVPVSPPPAAHPGRGHSGGTSGARDLPVDGGPINSPAGDGDGEAADAPPASVTAELLLSTFVQSQAEVRRSLREAIQQAKCDGELLAVQTALRRALCTAPAPPGEGGGPAAAVGNVIGGKTPTPIPLSAGLGARKAPACLLAGFLVEGGAPGWEDTKAAMIPPPHQLLEAAEGPVLGAPGHEQPPLTALRLEVWLRSLLCDADGTRFDAGFDMENSFPDVFRTARALARAIARHASALITGAGRGPGAPPPNGYHQAYPGGGSGGPVLPRPHSVNSASRGGDGGSRAKEPGVVGRLESASGALAGRLHGAPAAGALVSWASSIVKMARQYERWLPWQAFADELRELVMLSVGPPQPSHQADADGGDGDTGGERALAAEAAVFAVCELLLAWAEGDEEVVAAVFQPALCRRALSTVVAPVSSEARPPIWLEVLRCLCDGSSWSPSRADGDAQQDPLAAAAAAAVWIGGDGPRQGLSGEQSNREEWMRWYGAKLGPLIPTSDADLGNWLVLSGDTDTKGNGNRDGGIAVRMGTAGGTAHNVQPGEWENWGRSPLQAAWNFPGAWGARASDDAGASDTDARRAPPAIVLPPFASWLRGVLRGGPSCPDGSLKAYLRRMAREVYLPCQFNGASGEMARQWLGALIGAEAGAEGRRARRSAAASGAVSNRVAATKTDLSSESRAGTSSARRAVVKAFFREELLRFGSGEASVAPIGGPLTWLWPLEAVVAACGKAGPFGGSVLAQRRRGNVGPGGLPGDATARIALDGPPSALARALSAVPHDLICGARRFDRGRGQPPPAVATLRAFAMRAVDLAARALATPACRHWSVARRLLLGLGLLHHALAKPWPARCGEPPRPVGGPSRTGAVGAPGDNARAGGVAADSQSSSQAAALSAIETLITTALGLSDDRVGAVQSGSSGARVARGAGPGCRPGGTLLLTPACLALTPLETGSCVGAADFAEALMGAGAWRAAAAFFGPRKPKPTPTQQACGAASLAAPPAVAQPARSLPSSPRPLAPPPLSPVVDSRPHHRYSSPGAAVPAEDVDRPVGGHRANGRSIADALLVGEQPGSAGGREVDADSAHPPPWRCPATQQETPSGHRKKARVSNNPAERKSPPSSPRRVLSKRSSMRPAHDGGGS